MNHIKKFGLLLTVAGAWSSGLWAVTQVEQTVGTPSFAQNIFAKTFDRETGTLFVATAAANGDKTFARAGASDTAFTSLNANASAADFVILPNEGINASPLRVMPASLLALLKSAGGTPWLVGVQASRLSVFNGSAAAARQQLGADLKTGGDTANIAATAAQGTHKLAAGTQTGATGGDATGEIGGVRGKAFIYGPTATATPGGNHDGVCSINIRLDNGNLIADGGPTPGLREARPLNAVESLLGAGGVLGLKAAGAATQAACGGWVNDLYWDEELQVLYAGVSIRNDQHAAANSVNSLVKATLAGATGILTAFSKVDGTANNEGPLAVNPATATVFSARDDNNGFWGNGAISIVRKIRGMKTSTDKKYLILNAMVGASGAANIGGLAIAVPSVYAVRVHVEPGGPTHGNVIKNEPDVNGDDEVLANDWTAADLGATQVGAGNLPFRTTEQQYVSDIEVVGDTVYASVGKRMGAAADAGVRDANNDIGVFSSRALFDHRGIIIGWTPWERVFVSETDPTDLDAIHFFAADATNGVFWKICKDPTGGGGQHRPRVVKRTAWTPPTIDAASEALAPRLNAVLNAGCTAVLDLPTSTPGIGAGGNASNSFTLFGGNELVVFAQTKNGNANAVEVAFETHVATAYQSTALLPAGAGYVRALGYSRFNPGGGNTAGFFFAGTDNGLYVFGSSVANPIGFDTQAGLNTLGGGGLLNGFAWKRMAEADENAIKGAVTAIESNGAQLFVVEQDVTNEGAIVSKLHRFTLGNNVNGMLTTANGHVVIAQSGSGNIPANAVFTGFGIVSSDGARTNTLGILATNAGVFKSDASIHNSAPGANWTALDDDNAYTILKSIKRLGNQDGLALGFAACALATKSDNDFWQQTTPYNSALNFGGAGSKVNQYVNAAAPAGNDIEFVDRLTSFWTDGGRHIFSTYNPTLANVALQSMPFATAEWNMTEPNAVSGLIPNFNRDAHNIFWIENISGLGILMAGTNKGVITLE